MKAMHITAGCVKVCLQYVEILCNTCTRMSWSHGFFRSDQRNSGQIDKGRKLKKTGSVTEWKRWTSQKVPLKCDCNMWKFFVIFALGWVDFVGYLDQIEENLDKVTKAEIWRNWKCHWMKAMNITAGSVEVWLQYVEIWCNTCPLVGWSHGLYKSDRKRTKVTKQENWKKWSLNESDVHYRRLRCLV